MGFEYDFCGWATKNDLLCSDGRTIRKNAFAHQDGEIVPMVWNHDHKSMENVVGHAMLKNMPDGVYTYGVFNDTPNGRNAKQLVQHGDISALSIFANKLKQKGNDVLHGQIREVSLVYAGANPGAFIENVITHGEEDGDSGVVYTGENLILEHGVIDNDPEQANEEIEHSDAPIQEVIDGLSEEKKKVAFFLIAKAIDNKTENAAPVTHAEAEEDNGPTVAEVWETFTEKEKKALYAIIAFLKENGTKAPAAAEHSDNTIEEDTIMHTNMFDASTHQDSTTGVLTHADQEAVLKMARSNSVGSLREALTIYANENEHLAHGINEIETLFPEYKNLGPAAPEMLTSDQGWITKVMNGVHKSPFSRIRTRQMDVKAAQLRAKGYKKGEQKENMGNVNLLKRTTDPQTVYVKDSMNRDDIIDITDFDVVDYEYKMMKMTLNEEIATAIMIGDGRDVGDDDKISEDHIRSIWHDDELYTIHKDVDLAAAAQKLQGSDTNKSFGEDYIFTESVIEAALFSRENYKGSGNLVFFCEPHAVNRMLMARDMNGRRIYDSVSDLAKALNVTSIQTAEQFAGKTRSATGNKTKKLIGIFVNLNDYQVGATKGGEISQFNQFDIDYNKEKYLIETRLSGALIRVKSAIALEEDVTVTG